MWRAVFSAARRLFYWMPAFAGMTLLDSPRMTTPRVPSVAFPPALNRHLTKIRPNDVPQVCELLRPKFRGGRIVAYECVGRGEWWRIASMFGIPRQLITKAGARFLKSCSAP